MIVNLSFVPPGGGETDYTLPMDMPEVPHAGDYLSITRPEQEGSENFIVKRTWWSLEYNDATDKGVTKTIWVECEFAKGPFSSESHRRACDRYASRTGDVLEFEESMY